ncbi:low-density lipoprotein receptor-like [Styela clava]
MESGFVYVLLVCVLLSAKIEKGSGCSKDDYSCLDRTQCIPLDWFCDGYRDCRDGSDEFAPNTTLNGMACRRYIYICDLPRHENFKNETLCKEGENI